MGILIILSQLVFHEFSTDLLKHVKLHSGLVFCNDQKLEGYAKIKNVYAKIKWNAIKCSPSLGSYSVHCKNNIVSVSINVHCLTYHLTTKDRCILQNVIDSLLSNNSEMKLISTIHCGHSLLCIECNNLFILSMVVSEYISRALILPNPIWQNQFFLI